MISNSVWNGILPEEGVYTNIEATIARCHELARAEARNCEMRRIRNGDDAKAKIDDNYKGRKNEVWVFYKTQSYVFRAVEVDLHE